MLEILREVTRSSDQLFAGLSESYAPIAAKIKAAKWARILRNKISFHYDQKHALAALDELPDDQPLRLILGRIKGITLFDFAEEIVGRPIFEVAGKGDVGIGMDVSNKFVIDLVGAITSFHAQATISIFKSFGLVSQRDQTELRERYCGAPGNFRIPISLSSAYLQSRRTYKVGKRGRRQPQR